MLQRHGAFNATMLLGEHDAAVSHFDFKLSVVSYVLYAPAFDELRSSGVVMLSDEGVTCARTCS
jgi:hypothetical protein